MSVQAYKKAIEDIKKIRENLDKAEPGDEERDIVGRADTCLDNAIEDLKEAVVAAVAADGDDA